MDLASFLRAEVAQSSLRDVAGKTGVSKTAIANLITGKHKALPALGTLVRIAIAYQRPLYEVMEMAGVDLGLPADQGERVKRLQRLVERRPALERLVGRLSAMIDTHPDYVDGMIVGFEAMLDQQARDDPKI